MAVVGEAHDPLDTSRTTYVDITDLLAYLRAHEAASEVQGTQCEMLREAMDGNVDRSLCFVVLDGDRGLCQVESTALLGLLELVSSPSASRVDIDHKLMTLLGGMAPPFVRPHDVCLAFGAFWAVHGVGAL